MTEERGIRLAAPAPDPAKLTILEMTAGGGGFFDVEGDGDLDLLLLGLSRCALYLNDGGGRFRDASASAGLDPAAPWMGCATGDYDGDGRVDLFLTGYRTARLYRNLGGHFTDATAGSGIRPDRWYTSAAFADVDGDGDLDLYAGAYVEYGPEAPQHCPVGVAPTGEAVMGPCGPEPYRAQVGRLYLNEGSGRFRDVTRAAGLDRAAGKTLGVAFADFDADGDPDLYLSNDRMACDLFRNEGSVAGVPRFRSVGLVSGTAYTRDGQVQSGMGVDWGDYDNDGRLDLFVANFEGEPKSLYRNEGGGQFREAGFGAGLAPAEPFVSFGTRFVDVDNDGWLDLFLVNGHVFGPVEKVDSRLSFAQPMQLFHNRGGAFEEISASLGPGFARRIVGRAAAIGDIDNDGRTDLLAVDLQGQPVLLRNETETGSHWLRVRLEGRGRNRQGIGARVSVRAQGRLQVREVTTAASYLAASDPRVLFGLGPAGSVEGVTVRWRGGRETRIRPAAVDREIVIRETGGTP